MHRNMAAAADDGSMWIAELTFTHGPILLHSDETDGLRLITMITATKADGSIFWKSPFYRSTGKNSSHPGLWFPFAGFSKKRLLSGAVVMNYFSKMVGLPNDWPKEDAINTKGWPPSKVLDFIGRMPTRSFLLASNFMEAFGQDPANVSANLRMLFGNAETKMVDSIIKERCLANTNFSIHNELYETLAPSTSKEINAMIGTDLFFNPYLEDKLNLAKNNLPNYHNVMNRVYKSQTLRKGRRSRKTRRNRSKN